METLLRAELAELKASALQRRAKSLGVGDQELDDAVDSDDPKSTLIDLIVGAARASERRLQPAAPAAAPSPTPAPAPALEPAPETAPATRQPLFSGSRWTDTRTRFLRVGP